MGTIRFFFQTFWVACSSITLLAQTRLLLGYSLQPQWVDGFVFGGTVFGYHCTHPNRQIRTAAWGMGLLGGICFLLALPTDWVGRAQMGFPILFWLAYYGFQKPGNAGLRGKILAKPITIALTWAWVTVLLPSESRPWSVLGWMFVGRAAFIFSLALAYDLCDVAHDHRYGLNTLSRKLGFKRSFGLIYLGLGLAALCVCANLYYQVYGYGPGMGLLLSLGLSAGWLRIVFLQDIPEAWKKPLIDGLMVLQFLLVLLFSAVI